MLEHVHRTDQKPTEPTWQPEAAQAPEQTAAITATGTVTVTKQGTRVTRPRSGPATPRP